MRLLERRILLLRGQRVMLDADLAEIYGASTKRLNQQVRRNQARFPEDFVIRLTPVDKTEVVFAKIRGLIAPKTGPSKRIGFTPPG